MPIKGIELQSDIDKVVYLASMASNPSALDKPLNVMRAITAQLQGKPDAQADAQSAKKLQDVQATIKDYLINKEPVGQFTAQTIDEKLYLHTSGKNTMRYLHRVLGIICAITILATLAAAMAPFNISPAVRPSIAVGLFFATLHLGAVWLFVSVLGWFRSALRPAYIFVCVGLAIIGFSQLLSPVFLILHLNTAGWVQAASVLPFVPASALLYFGVLRIAVVTGTKSRFASIKLLLISIVVFSVVSVLAPHARQDVQILYFNIALVFGCLATVFNALAAIVMRQVAHNVSPLYAKSMKWLYRLLLISTIGNIGGTFLVHFAPDDSQSIWVGLISLPFIVSGFVAVKAGYEFNKITR